jgi:hypothetical protein
MDALGEEYEKLSKRDNLSGSLADVQKTIDMLTRARDSIAESKYTSSLGAAGPSCPPLGMPSLTIVACSDPGSASITLAKLQNPVKQSFDQLTNDLKEVYKGLGNYSKALDKVAHSLTGDGTKSNPCGSRSSKANRCPQQIMMLYPRSHR